MEPFTFKKGLAESEMQVMVQTSGEVITTWGVSNPRNSGINYPLTDSGFLPSTISGCTPIRLASFEAPKDDVSNFKHH